MVISDLDSRIVQILRAAYADSTWKNIKVGVKRYMNFTSSYALVPFPASTEVLLKYLSFLSFVLKSPDSVRNYLSHVRTAHIWLGCETVNFKHDLVQIMLKGLKRFQKHQVQRAVPVTPDMLVKILQHVDLVDREQIIAWTVMLVAFYLFLRKSNLVPDSRDFLNAVHVLFHDDLWFTDHDILFRIRWTKTVQFAEREL